MTGTDAQYVQRRLLLDMGATEEAEETIARTLSLDPRHLAAREALGRSQGKYQGSLESDERAIALNRESPAGWYGLSAPALALNRTTQANAAMRHIQDLDRP